nr:hypothetical protein CFP56_62429 [Quercus suber]
MTPLKTTPFSDEPRRDPMRRDRRTQRSHAPSQNPASEPSKRTDEQTNAGVDEPRRRRACSSPPLIRSERVPSSVRIGAWVRRQETQALVRPTEYKDSGL